MTWSPLDIPRIQLLLTPAYGQHNWQESLAAQNQANVAGQRVGTIDEPVNGFRLEADSDSSRPVLGNDATYGAFLDFDSGSGNKRTYLRNSAKFTRFIHQDRDFWVFCRLQFTNALASAGETIADQVNLSAGSGAVGFCLFRNANEGATSMVCNGSGAAALTLTGANSQLADTNVHEILVRVKPGPNASSQQVDNLTAATGTVGASGGTDASADMQFGLRTASSSPGNCKIYLFAMGTGDLAAEDLAKLRAYKPQLSPTGSLGRHLGLGGLPTDHSHLIGWWDFTDQSSLRQEDGATAITAENDPVGLVINQKTPPAGCDFNRNWAQTVEAKCPLWKLDQVNGRAAPYWNGSSADVLGLDFTGENNLVFTGNAGSQVNRGAQTWFFTYRALRPESGSHLMRGSSAGYVVQTGSGYAEGAPRGDVVTHDAAGHALQSPINTHAESVSVLAILIAGTYLQTVVNGYWSDIITNFVCPAYTNMGRPYNPPYLGLYPWDMLGNILEVDSYAKLLTPAEIYARMTTLAAKHAAADIYLGPKPLLLALRGEQI